MGYYDRELQEIMEVLERGNEVVSFKFTCRSKETKYMALNIDSVESLKAFADIVTEVLNEQLTARDKK